MGSGHLRFPGREGPPLRLHENCVKGLFRDALPLLWNFGQAAGRVTSAEVFGYAHRTGFSGKQPSSVTIGARIACLSSFYRFLIRMSLIRANPCDQLERPKATPALPRGLTATDIKKPLEAIPDNPVGLRDRPIILALTITGRRRAEVLNLKAGDLTQDGERGAAQTGDAPASSTGHTAGEGCLRRVRLRR